METKEKNKLMGSSNVKKVLGTLPKNNILVKE